MIEFYTFSWATRIAITLILGFCVLNQTIGMVISSYRRSSRMLRLFETIFEVAILCEILVLSILYGQVINGYKNGFVVPTGYENARIFIFFLILIVAIIISILNKNSSSLFVILATVISLPIIESMLGSYYPWFFIAVLIFFLVRSCIMSISSFKVIKTNISALSIIQALNSLHTGVLFSEKDGYILLSNHQMQNLMITMTGKVFRNAIQFYELLISDRYESKYKKAELDGQRIFILENRTVWIFTKTDVSFGRKKYIHISATNVSKNWELTAQLQSQAHELGLKSDELKKAIANLHTLSKDRDLENTKMRVHDVLGQRLSLLLRTIQNNNCMDYELLMSLSKGLLDELKEEENISKPNDEFKDIQQIFARIGVVIKMDGQLPEDENQASLLVDIISESATNAVRHGLATEININAKYSEQTYNMTIINNGYTTITPIVIGSGIEMMRKKLSIKGGNMKISHYPLFTLFIELPGGNTYV